MPKCANTDKQKISQYRWLPISEPIIGATLLNSYTSTFKITALFQEPKFCAGKTTKFVFFKNYVYTYIYIYYTVVM